MSRALVSITLAVLVGLTAGGASAQESASSAIVGILTDTTQASLPGATITVTQVGTGAQRVVVTDSEGRFSVQGLRPATYDIKADLAGFNSVELKAIVLRTGETVRPSLTMGLGAVSEQITVTGTTPLLQTASASVGAVINEKMLEEIPLAGRTLLNIATTAPGVTARNFQQGQQYGRRDQYVVVEGGRDSSTNYAIDGVYVRSLRFNNMSLNPPVDAVQEVNVLRNAFSTEYGQGSAVVSMVTKSGTNRFTGSAAHYFRNDALNAKNYFATAKPPYERNQFGFTTGGPVMHNKLFVFGGFEGLRETQGEVQLATAITDARWLNGDFSGSSAIIRDPLTGLPFPGNMVPADRVSQFARTQVRNTPIANEAGAVNNYRQVRNFEDTTNTFTLRLDQNVSSAHTLFQRYIHYNSDQILPAATTFGGRPQDGRNLAAGHTWVISQSLVNETRFGYNYAFHSNYNFLPGDPDYNAESFAALAGLKNIQGALPGQDFYYGYPGATLAGVAGPPNTGVFQGATEDVFSFSNATSKVMGGHNLRFGVQYQGRKFYQSTPVGQNGAFTFNGRATGGTNVPANSFADFLLGYCSACAGQFGTADSTYRSPTFAPFIDDVWAVNARLTVQAGLRWEYIAPWHEINDVEATFDKASGKIAFHKVPANIPPALLPLVNTQDDFYPAGITKKDLNNFGPRLGIVYSLNDKTVIRSGFGIYYDNLNLNELQFMRLVPPFAGRFDLSPAGTALVNVADLFPDISTATTFPAPFAIDPENDTAYTRQWNVNVQRTLTRDLMLEVAYTGSRSYNEHKRYNVNQPSEGTTLQALRLPYPAFAPAILTSSDSGHGDFEGVSFKVDKRFSRGLFFTGAYQLSRNRDNNSGEAEANDTAFAWNHEADYGYSRNDQRHRGTITFGYDLPRFENKAVDAVAGNWQVSGNIRMQSGRRFSVSVTAAQSLGSFVPSRANFAPGREDDKGELGELTSLPYLGSTALRWFDPTAYAQPAAGFQGLAGRNTLIGPSFRRVDLGVTRRFPIGGARRADFRVEIFNALNTVNFANPAGNISNANAGTITQADDPRVVQLSVRFNW